MKLYLLSDYCRIDGETADFAEKEFREGFEKYDTEIFLFSARNQMVSFQLITEMNPARPSRILASPSRPLPVPPAASRRTTRSLSNGFTASKGLLCRICSCPTASAAWTSGSLWSRSTTPQGLLLHGPL